MPRAQNTVLLLACALGVPAHAQETTCDSLRSSSSEIAARSAQSARDFKLAAQHYQEAFDACPENRRILLSLAQAQLAGRDFNEAIRAAESYLSSDRRSVPGRVILASAYLMARRLPEAMAEAEQILQDQPEGASALKIKGNSAYLMGDVGKAKEAFIRLLDRHPQEEEGAYMLGRIYYQEGSTQLAIGQFERVLRLNPNSYKALDNLGLCHEALGDDGKAMRYFLIAIKLVEKDHPEYEWPYTNLSELLLKSNDPQRAFDAAAKAANRNPQSARSFYLGAKALDQLGKTDLSLNWLQRSTALDSNNSEAWYLLSRLYRKLGQTEQAEAAQKRFREVKAKEPATRR